ncbi:MAG: hypothetical protein OSA97_02845 [Nevskia sp.]|nr:hypothetical protein [Nevskia sp.]
MSHTLHSIAIVLVLLLSAYSLLKFAFFFLLPYEMRRAAVDKAYAGRAYATAKSDMVLFIIAVGVAAFLLAQGSEPIAFLGGLFVGATLIQMFFHAYHEDPPVERQAPAPKSPLKRMSYAIQDRPSRAGLLMAFYAAIVLGAVAIYFVS